MKFLDDTGLTHLWSKITDKVEDVTPSLYTAEINIEGVLLSSDATYESIVADIQGNKPIHCLMTWSNELISMRLAEWKQNDAMPHVIFVGEVRNADSAFIFWFHIQSDGHRFVEIKTIDNELVVFEASFGISAELLSTTATYEAIVAAILKNKEVIIKTTWHQETIYMRLGEWKAGHTIPYCSFYGFVRDGYQCKEFFLHIGANGEHTFSDNRTYQMIPYLIYDDPTGFEANDEDVGDAWQLTGLDLSNYKRLKFYICSAGDSDTNWSPSHIVEMDLDNRARGSNGHFTAGHTAVCPNATGRFHNVVCSVSADKTALAFNRSNRYNASTSATAIGGRYCYKIEGYYN